MKLGSSSVKASALGEILFYVTALDYKDREYNDAEELLCAIIYEVLQQRSIFCLFESILIDLFCCVKFRSITGNLRKKLSSCCGFCDESANQFEVSPLGSVFVELTHKIKTLLQ